MENGSIYHDGVVLILETSCWGARKKLPQDRINVSADPKFVSGTKRLVDHEKYLKPIRRNQQQAFERIRDRWAVPGFPLTGASFIPKANIETVDSILQEHLRAHEELVREFLPLYPRMKEEARAQLEPDGLFDEEEYPKDVLSRFSFTWKYVILEAPDAGANVMTAPMLEREKEKIGLMIEEFRANAVAILRKEFARTVAGLAECLKSGNKRRIRQESLESLNEWIERFERVNINNDRELAGIVETMRSLVVGTDAKELRNNDLFRRTISNQMAEISVTLASLAEEVPKRRIVPVNPDCMNASQAG
ncbi:MAG: DUF3150 domain-containing protein [bacterium]